MDIKKINNAINTIKEDMDGGLLSCDVWDKKASLSIASYNPNPKFTALFGKIIKSTEDALDSLGFPPIGEFQITDLDMDSMLLIINIDDKYYLSSIIDKTKAPLGLIINIIVPNASKVLREAIND